MSVGSATHCTNHVGHRHALSGNDIASCSGLVGMVYAHWIGGVDSEAAQVLERSRRKA